MGKIRTTQQEVLVDWDELYNRFHELYGWKVEDVKVTDSGLKLLLSPKQSGKRG